eukprot:Rmarinus@m.11042
MFATHCFVQSMVTHRTENSFIQLIMSPCGWPFFADIGMQTDVTAESFLDCARFVSSLASTEDMVSASVRNKAEALLLYLQSNLNTKLLPSLRQQGHQQAVDRFCDDLSDISIVPIIPPNADSENRTSGAVLENVEYRFVTLKGCILPDDFLLGWLAAPVIPTNCVPPRDALHKLRVMTPIPPCLVLKNLKNLGSAVKLGKMPRKPLEEVVVCALTYFREKWDDLQPAEKTMLKSIPLVPIGDAMYQVTRVVRGLVSADQYAPILRKLPKSLECHSNFLENLGLIMKATPKILAKLTMELVEEFGIKPLNVCEVRALNNLHNLILASPDSDETQDRDWILHDREVVVQVPTEDSILASARMCHFDDMPWLTSRIHRKKVQFVHPSVSADVCAKLGIKPLTSVLHETLADGFSPKPVDGGTIGPISDAAVTNLLGSLEFAKAVVQVIRQDGPDTDWAKRVTVSKVREKLMNIRACFVEVLETRFIVATGHLVVDTYTSDKEGQKIGGTDVTMESEGTPAFVEERMNCLYVAKQSLQASGLRVEDALSRAVCTLLGFPQLLPLSALFSAASTASIEGLPAIVRSMQWCHDTLRRGASRGIEGEVVVQPDLGLVEADLHHRFFIGEVVAWTKERWPTAQKILSEVQNGTPALQVYYGTVRNASQDPVTSIYKLRVMIDTDGTTRDVLSTQLLTFGTFRKSKSASKSNTMALAAAPSQSQSRAPTPVLARSSRRSIVGTNSMEGESSTAPEREEVSVHISEKDVVDALEGYHNFLGLPLQTDQKSILEELVSAKRDAKQKQETIDKLTSRATAAEEALQKKVESAKCHICMSATADTVTVPCGHLFCGTCINTYIYRVYPYRNNYCPHCGAKTTSTVYICPTRISPSSST